MQQLRTPSALAEDASPRAPRRILMLVSSMNAGGAERVAAHLADTWVERGDMVTLLVTFSGRGGCFYPLSPRVRLVYLSDLAGCTGKSWRAYWKRFASLRRFMRDARADVIVSFLTNVNIAALLAGWTRVRGLVVCEHTHPPACPLPFATRVLRRLTYSRAGCVTLLTRESREWMEAHIPGVRAAVIPNPVNFPLPEGAPRVMPQEYIAPHRRLLLAVGRLSPEKQFERLIAAFAIVARRHPSWDLVILGEGPERGRLELHTASARVADRVKLPGRVGSVGEWYRRADLYAMSSAFEGFPNTLAEAMAHGCAVVSYDCDTGPRDMIRDRQDGILVNPVGDVAALASALDTLMSDESMRRRLARRAVEIRERYSLARIVGMWDEVFDRVAKQAS